MSAWLVACIYGLWTGAFFIAVGLLLGKAGLKIGLYLADFGGLLIVVSVFTGTAAEVNGW